MRVLIILWTLVVVVFSASSQDVLQLKNGDRFRGAFIGFDAAQGFGWKHNSIFSELWVESSAVSRLQLNASEGAIARSHSARVKFINGDELSMDISGLDAESLSLDTWFAGKLKSPRKHLMWLVPGGTGAVIYDGPKSLRGWGAGLIGVLLGDDGDLVGGVTVMEVMPSSPALKAGMQIGDIVTHVNGKAVTLRGDMIQKVKQNQVGDKVKIGILRGKKPMDFIITLAALNWEFEGGALKSTGAGSLIGREFKWPRTSNLSFDFEWKNMPAMDIILCADKVRESNSFNGYKLRLNRSYAYLYRNNSADGAIFSSSNLGSVALKWPSVRVPIGDMRKVNFSVRINQDKAMISLLQDGRIVKTWRDPKGFAGRGGAIGFQTLGTESMKIFNLRLRDWNGHLPSGSGPSKSTATQDIVQFTNDDSLSGKILGIKDAKLVVKTSFGEVPLPMTKISNIVFAEQKIQPSALSIFNLRGVGHLTGKLLDWNENGVKVNSPIFGEMTLSPKAISSVQFR